MKLAEKILWGLFLLSVLLRLLHVPMYGLLTILSLSGLMILYFWLSALLLPTPARKDQRIVLSILVGIAISIGLMGDLYKLQAWPHADLYLLISLALMVGAFALALFLLRGRADLVSYRSGLVVRLAFVVALTMLIRLVPQRQMLSISYPDEPERVELIMRLLEENMNDSTRNSIHEQLRQLDGEKFRREYPMK